MLCFDNLTLPPPLLRPALPTPSKYALPIRQRSAGIGLWRPLRKPPRRESKRARGGRQRGVICSWGAVGDSATTGM